MNKKTIAIGSVIIAGVLALGILFPGEEQLPQPSPPPTAGWNIISMPSTVNKTDVWVFWNGTSYSWQEAIDELIILDYTYGYGSDKTYFNSDTFESNKGYWMFWYQDDIILSDTSTLYVSKINFGDNYTNDLDCQRLVIAPESSYPIINCTEEALLSVPKTEFRFG